MILKCLKVRGNGGKKGNFSVVHTYRTEPEQNPGHRACKKQRGDV